MSDVVTRFPPSPTGLFHIGSARTALFNYLYAKKTKGRMVLRMEDTDRERSKKEYETSILESLAWLGIRHDGEVTRQSERSATYRAHIERMIAGGKAYVSEEQAEEGKRASVIRFKNPRVPVTFHDQLRGDITVDPSDLGDFVIAKDLDSPLYHLAVVIDDHEMGITHVIRGEDGIANTPRQILIQEAIGAKRPIYVHIPLILAPDRTKLSKRHGATAVTDYREEGYLPQAIVNFLALLGWNPGGDREFFTMDELIAEFSLEKLQKGAAVFNIEKLNWFNAEYIKKMSPDEWREYVKPLHLILANKYGHLTDAYLKYEGSVIKNSIVKIEDALAHAKKNEYEYFFGRPHVAKESLLAKGSIDPEKAKEHLMKAVELLESCDYSSEATIKAAIMPYADAQGRKDVLWPMRFALSGRDKSPDPFFLAYILGKHEAQERITAAAAILG